MDLLTNSSDFGIGLFFGGALFLIIIIIFFVAVSTSADTANIGELVKTSARFQGLLDLNKEYVFHEDIIKILDFDFELSTKAKFDHFNYRKQMKALLADDIDYYYQLVNHEVENLELYNKYCNAINELPAAPAESELDGVKYSKYMRILNEVFDEHLLHPVFEVIYRVNVSYESPGGRNYYDKHLDYSYIDILSMLEEIQDEIQFKETKTYQRRAMTNSIRYDVLRRDCFRCVLCGQKASDGIKLHVDHIIPIAKGGKTTMDNLRTLCNLCNSGKSDKYVPGGLN